VVYYVELERQKGTGVAYTATNPYTGRRYNRKLTWEEQPAKIHRRENPFPKYMTGHKLHEIDETEAIILLASGSVKCMGQVPEGVTRYSCMMGCEW
jgi:hypothetical protein